MDPVAEIFADNIIVVYFFYGLAFFSMGLVVLLERARTSEFRIAQAMLPLALFGILHGLHEWFEMFQVLGRQGSIFIPGWLLLEEVRIAHLVASFLLLVIFGVRLLYAIHWRNHTYRRFVTLAAGGFLLVWIVSVIATQRIYQPEPSEFYPAVDALARYIIGIPGSLLAAWAIILEHRSFRRQGLSGFGRDLQWAAWSLVLYGLVGQLFPRESFIFPANIINAELFLNFFGFPIQFFRAVEAGLMAFFVMRALRAFEFERQQRLARAHSARLEAQQQMLETQQQARRETEQLNRELQERESMLAELLQQVVTAQENERQRIARELHDSTGQILTGLGLGLAAAADSVHSRPEVAVAQIKQMKELNEQAMQELHNVIADLRPSVLDDLGLVPAFQTQIREFEQRTGVKTKLVVEGRRRRVPPEIETIVFRIGQEALTNVAKHADADQVCIRLNFNRHCLELTVSDDGRGFDTDAVLHQKVGHRHAWGLLGIQERVALSGGSCDIISQKGAGTTIRACVPMSSVKGIDE
ncbi:MAG: sensor histidine kinase [Candidatus Promineifilaceae bacterium]|nr:sensor histidine kinase [Candidatus Promineifilaceae bacterium]